MQGLLKIRGEVGSTRRVLEGFLDWFLHPGVLDFGFGFVFFLVGFFGEEGEICGVCWFFGASSDVK